MPVKALQLQLETVEIEYPNFGAPLPNSKTSSGLVQVMFQVLLQFTTLLEEKTSVELLRQSFEVLTEFPL